MFKVINKIFLQVLAVATFALPLFMLGCASHPPIREYAATTDPSQEIANLKTGIDNAYSEQANMLSPNYIKKAEKQLKAATEARADNESNKDVLKEVAIGNAWLDKANAAIAFGKTDIPDIVDARAKALAAKADQYDKKGFRNADEELKDMGKGFEEGDKVSQKERAQLLKKYMDCEMVGLKSTYLSAAANNIQVARNEGAEKITPQTLNQVQKKYNDAIAFITANRQSTEDIQRISRDVTNESTRLLQITRQAKIDKNKSPEQIALEAERANAQKSNLSREVTSLAAGADLEKKFEAAQSQFDSSEAEVYKQGDKILIRLKGLNFPSGQAVLTTESYPLMAKVQATLQEMGESSVVIEGHTDSIGSKQINQKLSQERADAVKSYLINNNAVAENKIDSEGYGDQKPLSTNKTKQGRAENRRVDIIVMPQ